MSWGGFNTPAQFDPTLEAQSVPRESVLNQQLGLSSDDDVVSSDEDNPAQVDAAQTQKINDLEAKLAKLKLRVRTAQKESREATTEKKALEARALKAEQRVQELQQLSAAARTSLSKKYKDKIQTLTETALAQKAELEEADSIMEALHGRIFALEQAQGGTAGDVKEAASVAGQLKDARQQVRKLENHKRLLIGKVKQLEQELEDAKRQAAAQEQVSAKASKPTVEQKANGAATTVPAAQSSLSAQETEQLREELKKRQQDRKHLLAKISALQDELDTVRDAAHTPGAAAQPAANTASDASDDSKEKIEKLTAELENLRAERAQLASSLERAQNATKTSDKINQELKQQLQEAIKQRTAAEHTLRSDSGKEEAEAALKEQLTQAESKLQETLQTVEQLKQQLTQSQSTSQSAEQRTQAALEQKTKEYAALKKKATEKLELASGSIDKLKSEYVKVRDHYVKKSKQLEEKENQLKEANEAKAQLTNELRQAKETKAQLEAQLKGSVQDKNTLRRAHSGCVGLRSLLGNLRADIAEIPSIVDRISNGLQKGVKRFMTLQKNMQTQLVTSYKKEMKERKRLWNLVQELRGNIRVYCRVRPQLPTDLERKDNSVIITFPEENTLKVENPEKGISNRFEFEQVFTPKSTQVGVFQEVDGLITSVCDGYNVCIFAYGQTGSGKTFTMEGPPDNRGVNYRALHRLFELCEERSADWQYSVKVSQLEIYNESIRDLLGKGSNMKVSKGSRGMEVRDALIVDVSSIQEVLQVMKQGASNRAVGTTNMNEHSSRSHLIFSVYVAGNHMATGNSYYGKLHLIDLAGSERVSRSGASGQRLKEAQKINYSLSALGNCIAARANKNSHVPYRDSQLTYLLQDSLRDNSKTLMVVQVSPCLADVNESLCSLRFAERVRQVELGTASKNNLRVNTSGSRKSSRNNSARSPQPSPGLPRSRPRSPLVK